MKDAKPTDLLAPVSARWSLRVGSGGKSTHLPPDLLQNASRRLRAVSLLYAFTFFMADFVAAFIADRGEEILSRPRGWLPATLSIGLGLIVFALTFLRKLPAQRLMDVGLVFGALGSYGIAVAEFWGIFGETDTPATTVDWFGLSWVAVWMLFYTVTIPNHPIKSALSALVSAGAVPITIAMSMKYGGTELDLPPGIIFAGLIFPYLLCVLMSYVGARVVYRLGADVSRAREMGSYRLTERLGEGGMGEVWRAEHRMLARPAAIKLISPEALGARDSENQNILIRRFEKEAQATASMQSPHTIGIYDFGVTDNGAFYYVMELLDGFDTQRLVSQFGAVSPERTIHILSQVCHSLAEAHEATLIHRDIKPANVYLCRYGREVDFVKVLDFGLVKLMGEAEEARPEPLTLDHVVGGTPAFMAPEQVVGNRLIDGRADLYAVGCLGYWLLTGQLVFEGETPMKIMMDHVNTPPAPPSARTELTIPAELDEIILSCLEKDPDRRPPHADDLAERLAACPLENPWTAGRARSWWDAHHPTPLSAESAT